MKTRVVGPDGEHDRMVEVAVDHARLGDQQEGALVLDLRIRHAGGAAEYAKEEEHDCGYTHEVPRFARAARLQCRRYLTIA